MSTKKIQHTVLFKFPELETGSEGYELMDQIVKKFDSLEGISARFSPGENTDGWTHCLFVVADTTEALKIYLHHDYHLKEWMAAVKPYIKGIIVFDSEFELKEDPNIVHIDLTTGDSSLPQASVKPHLGADFLASVNWPDKAGGYTYILTAAFADVSAHQSFLKSTEYTAWQSSLPSSLSFSCTF